MKKSILLIFLSFFFTAFLHAHPHMAIYYRCNFLFEDNTLKGSRVTYRFDRYFSTDIISTYDLDKNKNFDKNETMEIYSHAFINLENYGFFISIRDNHGRTSPRKVSDFRPFIDEENMLNYSFYIELTESEDKELYFSIFDPTFFCATYMNENDPVIITAEPPHVTEYEVVENTDFPVFYDPYAPASDASTYSEWRPGLNTFFPEEIHLVY